ncbi:alpha-tocopherol transfer protein [Musca vetustissima]|uniref:alpha-tocopherol transfer protein n=1 Tax=Musca vetustissima TaxID=27455 RepID=UPI002AB64607|nr:alpha-tocopherol transfer protein [Musca vetustissima]
MMIEVEKQLDEMQMWLKTQTQLPQNIDRWMLRRFLMCMEGDKVAAQKLITTNYTMRNKYDHIFIKRDPKDEKSQIVMNAVDFLTLPGYTSEKYKLVLYRLGDIDPDKFNVNEVFKVFFMMVDSRFKELRDENAIGEIVVFDMTGFTLKHLSKFSLGTIRMFMKYIQEAHVGRVKGVHVINAASFLDKVMFLVRPFLKGELVSVLHFHMPKTETAYKFFPREMLPNEYGGKAGKLEDLRAFWVNKLMENR